MAPRDTMKPKGCVKFDIELPKEIIELVLSFLPVTALCKMRSVCKAWNEIISRPSFHDLCDRNRKSNNNDMYLFMWKVNRRKRRHAIEPSFKDTLSFLDLQTMRWRSIPAGALPKVCVCGNEVESRLMSMNDGLVCELTSLRETGKDFMITVSDPVAKTRKALPPPPEFYHATHDVKPLLVTVVDDVTRNFKVFVLNNLYRTPRRRSLPRVYVYESFTNEWRGMRNVPDEVVGLWASSGVSLHQTVFVVSLIIRDFEYDQLSLLSHKSQGDTWAEVWRMSFSRSLQDSVLVVSNNRLFVIVWLAPARCKERPVPPGRVCPNSESLFQTNQDYPGVLYEMYEILIAEISRKPVVQLSQAQVQQIFGSQDLGFDVSCGYPCFDSDGTCNSVILVSTYTGQIRRYYLETGSVDILPPHPSVQTSEEPYPNIAGKDLNFYKSQTMKLSVRNLLAQRPKDLDGVETLAMRITSE